MLVIIARYRPRQIPMSTLAVHRRLQRQLPKVLAPGEAPEMLLPATAGIGRMPTTVRDISGLLLTNQRLLAIKQSLFGALKEIRAQVAVTDVTGTEVVRYRGHLVPGTHNVDHLLAIHTTRSPVPLAVAVTHAIADEQAIGEFVAAIGRFGGRVQPPPPAG